ncbi:MAG: DUF1015 domain-containing protein [Oscillospiraceae bacterium]|jgi:uncharacterized protein (DUF1015 family)|nr:DUF1015 domain-containing protein [Oscillospiraceae bacterium]
MADVKAFKGLRYSAAAGDLAQLCCPPYDIVSDAERRAFLDMNPNNIIRLELPNPPSASPENYDAYGAARTCLNNWLAKGVLAEDRGENFYVYEMTFKHDGGWYRLKGFIALVKLEKFEKGVILPHEETLSKDKTDRFNLMTATGCNFSHVYSLYSDEDGGVYALIDQASSGEPDGAFTDKGGVTHKLWRVWDEKTLAAVTAKMANKKLFIADGHHRYETALEYLNFVRENKVDIGTSGFIPMMLVNLENPGLVVLPTHRIVRDLPHYNRGEFIARCSEYFDVTPGLNGVQAAASSYEACKSGKNAFVLFGGDGGHTLMVLKNPDIMAALLPGAHDCLRNLDVSVLHSLILENILGIDKENMAAQINLTYTGNAEEAVSAVDGKRADCCFLLNPTRVSEIRNVALTGGKMPQKSTYFYPKPATGLVMNRIFK